MFINHLSIILSSLLLLLICNHLILIECRLPLIDDDFNVSMPTITQRTQCTFDKDIYEIGEKWKPTIEPFGVYYCIICECIAVQRKFNHNHQNHSDITTDNNNNNRILAKVYCKNIKNDCPTKFKCNNPVLLPERCCKSCPEDDDNIEKQIASQKMDEMLQMKNLRKKFYAQLLPSNVTSNVTAMSTPTTSTTKAYLHLNKQRLAFMIKTISEHRPTYVRFQDIDDTIIEEYIVNSNNGNNNNTNKQQQQYIIYGTWKKLPKPYRLMLKQRHLKISLSFDEDIQMKSSLIGVIRKQQQQQHQQQHQQWNDQDYYYELLESNDFGKNSIFKNMLNTTSFVLYNNNPNLLSFDRKSFMMDQSSSSSSNSLNSLNSNHKCYYEAQIYDEGAQWKNQNDDCEMCFCQRGRVKCENEICLKLRCKDQIRIPGQCCPICKNKYKSSSSFPMNKTSNQTSCYFEGEKRYHLIGSRWHPYIPPFGFDRCTICMCTENAQIKCKRNECPPLPCSEHEAYRENPMDCCKKCRASTRSMETSMSDQATNEENVEQALSIGHCRFRGKIYRNGDEWNPAIDPYGEINCIKCRCKDGMHKCQRQKCKTITRKDCQKILIKGECCPVCADEQSSSQTSLFQDNIYLNHNNNGRRRLSTKSSRLRY